VADHAALEEPDAGLVVGLGVELDGACVFDKLPEFGGVPAAQFFKGDFDLLLLDGCVLLILTAAWQSLPRKGPLDEVQQDMSDGF